ncbi:hypothetical protein PVAP13_9NG188473 [Panicum virgatum]|uniref:Uncharacterized protein n=1 Tax=Panicum virgatum TaxID=38727 RepID=A0A8T0MMN8_PANVG|nr:hypothetical protein PVAP13_9NG188473 [Panicum virgatum]
MQPEARMRRRRSQCAIMPAARAVVRARASHPMPPSPPPLTPCTVHGRRLGTARRARATSLRRYYDPAAPLSLAGGALTTARRGQATGMAVRSVMSRADEQAWSWAGVPVISPTNTADRGASSSAACTPFARAALRTLRGEREMPPAACRARCQRPARHAVLFPTGGSRRSRSLRPPLVTSRAHGASVQAGRRQNGWSGKNSREISAAIDKTRPVPWCPLSSLWPLPRGRTPRVPRRGAGRGRPPCLVPAQQRCDCRVQTGQPGRPTTPAVARATPL